MFVELVRFVNVPNDRVTDGGMILGESWQDTALRIDKIIDAPPAPVARAAPVVPLEDRDPDAPPGWYDEPDMAALWLPGSMRDD